jgi:hypothetical protein
MNNKYSFISNENIKQELPCSNCREVIKECACMRNKCIKCGKSVGNITFSYCDDCWKLGNSLPDDLINFKNCSEDRKPEYSK